MASDPLERRKRQGKRKAQAPDSYLRTSLPSREASGKTTLNCLLSSKSSFPKGSAEEGCHRQNVWRPREARKGWESSGLRSLRPRPALVSLSHRARPGPVLPEEPWTAVQAVMARRPTFLKAAALRQLGFGLRTPSLCCGPVLSLSGPQCPPWTKDCRGRSTAVLG